MQTAKPTHDPEAQAINTQLDDVARAIELGRQLDAILASRFGGDTSAFRAWVRCHVDRDPLTITRYLLLYRRRNELASTALIRMSAAYQLLAIDGGAVSID